MKLAWWERLFDGHLKNLDVSASTGQGITFKQNEVVVGSVSKQSSPLYRRFVRGEGLKGTIGSRVAAKGNKEIVCLKLEDEQINKKRKRDGDDDIKMKGTKKSKAEKKSKESKEEKSKEDKKDKKGKKKDKKKDKKERKNDEKKDKKKDKENDGKKDKKNKKSKSGKRKEKK